MPDSKLLPPASEKLAKLIGPFDRAIDAALKEANDETRPRLVALSNAVTQFLLSGIRRP